MQLDALMFSLAIMSRGHTATEIIKKRLTRGRRRSKCKNSHTQNTQLSTGPIGLAITGPIGLAIAGLLDLLAWQLLVYWTYIGPGIAGLLDLVLCMRLLISDLICFQVLFQRRLMGGVVQHSLQTVLDFLKNYKLDKYSATFQEKGMDGDLLLKADNRVLKELGVTSAVDCKKIRTKYKTFIE